MFKLPAGGILHSDTDRSSGWCAMTGQSHIAGLILRVPMPRAMWCTRIDTSPYLHLSTSKICQSFREPSEMPALSGSTQAPGSSWYRGRGTSMGHAAQEHRMLVAASSRISTCQSPTASADTSVVPGVVLFRDLDIDRGKVVF